MSNLHSSLAYTSSSSLGWDLHNFGVFNADMPLGEVMESTSTPPYLSALELESDLSTGYLEDALGEFMDRSKRRRLLSSFPDDYDQSKHFNNHQHHHALSYWSNSSCRWDLLEDFNCVRHVNSMHGFSDDFGVGSIVREEASIFTEIQTPEQAISILDSSPADSSSSSFKDSSSIVKSSSDKDAIIAAETTFTSSADKNNNDISSKKRVMKRVVYPFAVVKPGGCEGDVTLNDINERILMPPTRPVRHPVGDFACRPCVSPHGPGLSGKAVVALTRVHTRGRGTITIIRTRG